MFEAVLNLLGAPSGMDVDYAMVAIALTCCLALLFVVVLVDFLARILSRFIPRWNRNS